jgi:hypothetical protein
VSQWRKKAEATIKTGCAVQVLSDFSGYIAADEVFRLFDRTSPWLCQRVY